MQREEDAGEGSRKQIEVGIYDEWQPERSEGALCWRRMAAAAQSVGPSLGRLVGGHAFQPVLDNQGEEGQEGQQHRRSKGSLSVVLLWGGSGAGQRDGRA